jgi:hypothetical protein
MKEQFLAYAYQISQTEIKSLHREAQAVNVVIKIKSRGSYIVHLIKIAGN